jgi:hypothetical protein
MDKTVELIGERLGWARRQPVIERLNVAVDSRTFVLDEATRAEIERFNTLDIELYRAVARRFADEVSAGGSA